MQPLPQARVFRQGGVVVGPPRVPLREQLAAAEARINPFMRDVVGAALGLWPVTAILLLALGLVYGVMMTSAP